jgi:hypothetical protein
MRQVSIFHKHKTEWSHGRFVPIVTEKEGIGIKWEKLGIGLVLKELVGCLN